MIKEIRLRFGRSPGAEPETIQTTPVTIFVGPNNSGKSTAIEDLASLCASGGDPNFINYTFPIVNHVEFTGLTPEAAEILLKELTVPPAYNEFVGSDQIIIDAGTRDRVYRSDYLNLLIEPNERKGTYARQYLQRHFLRIGGGSQISLLSERPAGDLQKHPNGSFQVLFRDNKKRQNLRNIIYEALSKYLVIDPTNLGSLRLRLSNTSPEGTSLEKSIDEAAVAFHSEAMPIERASDGTKAFIGILTEIIGGDPKVVLIDEPEAFLHPPLAYKLGREIARVQVGQEKRVFVATHSSNFVMGCIQSGTPVNIIRLTYHDNVPTARILPNDEILRLMRNPLLRSSNILSGLFYESIVITESDTDRAFYEEVNQRLLRYKPEWGVPNCLFVNAQNKQTIHTLMRPLRELGIPAVGIVDIDIIKEGGSVWSNLLTSASVPDISQRPLSELRIAIKTQLENTGKNMKRDGGFDLLQSSDKQAANDLFDSLASYGVFALRHGEIESWLKHLGATGHGTSWLINIFERMGEDDQSESYVRPDGSDVWVFLSQIKRWLEDPNRKGIPA